MELNWSTFVLEIINFLVLVWVLKRFLYKPVLAVIEKRRAGIERTLADAESRRAEAGVLQEQYENRLAVWEQEKDAAREALRNEIEADRARLLDELRVSLEQEREKARVVDERRLSDAMRRNEQAALRQGAAFAARLVSRLAGPDLEARLIDLVLEELSGLSPERLDALRAALVEAPPSVNVISAYPMDTAKREELKSLLGTVLGKPVDPKFHEDPSLIVGLRIMVGSWTMHANLQDELKSFAESGHE